MHLLMRIIKLDGPSIVSGVIRTATVCLNLRYLNIADFLFWLRKSKKLSVSAILGYRSMLSAVFRTVLPEISTSPVLQDLLRFFKVEAPCRVIRSPAWDLLKVFDYLRSSVFEALSNSSLRDLTRKTTFLVALAAAKRVGEIHPLSRFVSFSSSAAGVSYVPEFLAKTETVVSPLPRSSVIQSLGDFLIIFCCFRSALYMCMCLGLFALLIVLTGYLSPLVVLRDPCQRTLFLMFSTKLLFIPVPVVSQ